LKALIFSDSHGDLSYMTAMIDKYKDVKTIIHAGDVFSDTQELLMRYPRKNIIYVVGNNDYFVKNEPKDRLFELEGVKIFLTHGHRYSVKAGMYSLFAAAREKEARLCIFGHTHCRFSEEQGGIWLFNPGCARNSCGLLEISDKKINFEHIY